MPKFLDIDVVIELHDLIIETSGGSKGLRDKGALESCLHEPFQTVFGIKLHKNEYDKAAVMLRLIALNHPFVDGNKRTAMLAAIVYLHSEGVEISLTDKEYEEFMLRVVNQKISNRTIASWLKKHSNN